MKKEFTKEQIGFIKKTKVEIRDLSEKENKVFLDLLQTLGIDKDPETIDFLYDHIYNDFGELYSED